MEENRLTKHRGNKPVERTGNREQETKQAGFYPNR